jgi:hypothetical protein
MNLKSTLAAGPKDNCSRFAIAMALALTQFCIANNSYAAQVTETGNHFQITYDPASAGLFGSPILGGGNYLSFSPNQFSASQSNTGFDFSHATFNFRLKLDPGYHLSGLSFHESGNFWMMGAGSSVNVGGQIQVFDTDKPLSNMASQALARPINLDQRESALPLNWSSVASIDLTNSQWLNANSLSITVNSLLYGRNGPNGVLSFIEQKFGGIELDVIKNGSAPVSPVPEPAHWASLLIGLGFVARVVQRRQTNAST